MPETLSPQELLALESLSSLSLTCPPCQLPDTTVTSGWHNADLILTYTDGEMP